MKYFDIFMLCIGFFMHYALTIQQVHALEYSEECENRNPLYINIMGFLLSTLSASIFVFFFYFGVLHLFYFYKELDPSFGFFINNDYNNRLFLDVFIKENLVFSLLFMLFFASVSFRTVKKSMNNDGFFAKQPLLTNHILLYLFSLLILTIVLNFNLLNMTLAFSECNNGIISFEKNTMISEKLFGKEDYKMAFCTKLDTRLF